MREGDVCARVGGDQFAVLLNGVESSIDALRICEQLVALPAFAPRRQRPAAASTLQGGRGDQRQRARGCRIPAARRRQCSAQGTSQRQCRSSSSRPRCTPPRVRALQVEAELRKALTQGGLQAWYQPIVDLADLQPDGLRGPGPLAPPDARPAVAGRVHSARRSTRPDPRRRHDGARPGLFRPARHGRRDCGADAPLRDQREPLRAPARASRPRRRIARRHRPLRSCTRPDPLRGHRERTRPS